MQQTSGIFDSTLIQLQTARLMQLATVRSGKPWICTVYFVTDNAGCLYWLSLPTRRHSQDISHDGHVAAAIAIKADQPVIGVQVEGSAEPVREPEVIRQVMADYAAKYDAGHDFYTNFLAGTNQHVLYRLKPTAIVLFDEVHYPGDARRDVLDPDA